MNKLKTEIKYILLSICTCKRPKMLKEAILSSNKLILPKNVKVEILIVDNDAEKSAETVIDEISNETNLKIHYRIEPERGICNARNKILEEAILLGATHILFFDDDELLDKNTLIEHVEYYNNNEQADIISGPVPSIFKENYPAYIKNHIVFKQSTTKKTGLVRESCATGNVFFPVTIAKEYNLRFSKNYIFMGGEDGEFFTNATKLGFTIIWNNNAIIYEVVPPARANLKYILKKCYYNGFAGVHYKFKSSKKNKFLYIIKTIMTLFFNIVIIIPSLFLGLTAFFNVIGMCYRTVGKLDGVIKTKAYDFYKNIYGE